MSYKAGRFVVGTMLPFVGGKIYDLISRGVEKWSSPDKQELESEIKSGRLQSVHAAEKALATLNAQREKLIEQQQLDENAIQAQRQKIANLNMAAGTSLAKMDWDNFNRIQSAGAPMYYDWD